MRFYCGGAAESDVREVRVTLERDLNAILDAALGDLGWANAWGVPRATRQDKPWETAPEIEEHRPERGRVTHEGHGTPGRPPH